MNTARARKTVLRPRVVHRANRLEGTHGRRDAVGGSTCSPIARWVLVRVSRLSPGRRRTRDPERDPLRHAADRRLGTDLQFRAPPERRDAPQAAAEAERLTSAIGCACPARRLRDPPGLGTG